MSTKRARSRTQAPEEERDETVEDLQQRIKRQAIKCASLHAKADIEESRQLEKEARRADDKLHYLQSAALPGGFAVHRSIRENQKLMRKLREEREKLAPQPRAIIARIKEIDLQLPLLDRQIKDDVQKLMQWTEEDEEEA